jgi:endoglucanase
MKNRIRETFKKLNAVIGVTGREQEVVRVLRDMFAPYADEISITPLGNLIARKKGKGAAGPRLMLCAHSDEIGLSVKAVLPNGFIIYEKIGGVPNKLLVARHVILQGDDGPVPGVIGMKPGHLQTPEEGNRVGGSKESFIDVGAVSADEVFSMGIKVGTRAVFNAPFVEMRNPDIIATRAVDNRINCAILAELLKETADGDFSGELCVVISTQEECVLNTAKTSVLIVEPDYAIALDTIPAGDTPDVDTNRQLPVRLGKGPACPLSDSASGRAHFASKAVQDIIEDVSKSEAVNVQYLTLIEDSYITDAARIANAWKGVPTAVLAVPRRYSHSPVELFNLNDTVEMMRLLKGIVKRNGRRSLDFI